MNYIICSMGLVFCVIMIFGFYKMHHDDDNGCSGMGM
jgi:hypothetical protein